MSSNLDVSHTAVGTFFACYFHGLLSAGVECLTLAVVYYCFHHLNPSMPATSTVSLHLLLSYCLICIVLNGTVCPSVPPHDIYT